MALIAIFSLALSLRLVYVGGLAHETVFASVDAQGYQILATNLLQRGAFSLQTAQPYLPDGVRTPLYPAFLALILSVSRNADHAVPLAQALLDATTAALVYGLVSRLTTPRRGLVAASLYAINPISPLFIGEGLTEIGLAFLLALTFYIFTLGLEANQKRYALLAVSGLLSACCILFKPNVVALPLILSLGLVVHDKRPSWRTAREVGLLLGVALLGLSPWLVRNRVVFGQWFLSLAFDDNLAHVSAVATIAEAQGEEVAPWTPRWQEIYLARIAVPTSQEYGWTGEPLTPSAALQRQQQLAATAGKIIGEHPSAFLASHLKGALRSFVPSAHRHWYAYLTHQPWPASQALQAVLVEAGAMIGRGDWAGGLGIIAQWWGQHPAPARWSWATSTALYILSYGLIAAGLWALRARPGVLVSLGLTLLYLVLLPGPIAYIRFWVPGLPLAVSAMGCAFAGSRAFKPRIRGGPASKIRNPEPVPPAPGG
ncbi:MAG: glycosyltransferase family 39 protein [Anaerolineae bacterium]|nr:glycosyltransferase family 39 protein [Anaerolineae bacterium]